MKKVSISLFFLIFLISIYLHPAISLSERNALIDLYNSTDGDNWIDNTNWRNPGDPTQFNDPGTENTWFGVTVNGDNTHVIELELHNNGLLGTIPMQLNNLTYLTILDLRYNQLSGTIPSLSTLNQLEWLRLGSNNLTGDIPTWLNSLTTLYHIDLGWNQLSGTIPDLSNLNGLGFLSLGNNELTGSIPAWLNSLPGLVSLNLEGNQLSGEIPNLGGLTGMRYLYLSNNSLIGSIPSWINNFLNLYYLELRDNQLTGTIPDISSLSQLQVLDLGWNQLSGSIPGWLNSLTNLSHVNLRNNDLTGNIPDLGSLSGLQYLYLDNNRLSGSIPSGIGNLTALKYLYLHSNALTGSIPSSLSNLTNLYSSVNLGLDISYNGLYTDDSSLRDFLNSKHVGGLWENTQTVAPDDLTTGTETETSIPISWTPIDYQGNSGGYRIYYSTTPGSDYILSGTTDDKTVDNFTVSGLEPGTTYYFVLKTVTDPHSSNQNTVVSDYSIEVVAITLEEASITITSPDGGEVLMQDDPFYISWAYEGPVDNVYLYYSVDNGNTWELINGPMANNGGYDWVIPCIPSTDCLIKVEDEAGRAEDVSNGVFTIRSPSITVISPEGGEIFMQEDPIQIQWTYEGNIDSVVLSYSFDGGSDWVNIDGPVPNNGAYDWIVPTTPSNSCLVRVADVNGYAEDTNDTFFTIRPPSITVTMPNGGEIFMQEDPIEIRWTSMGHIDSVMLSYSFDGGSSWITFDGPVSNSGYYDWIVPTTPSTNCLVRVADVKGFAEDTSDAFFAIRPPSITVSMPNGGEIFMQEDPIQIQWTSIGHIDSVMLSYSFDGGTNWTNFDGPVPNSGYYDWITPTTPSTNCLVRITDGKGFAEDTSDAFFTIRSPTITVTSPNGGEIFMQENPMQIQWTSLGHVDEVLLSYSYDGGSNWTSITEAIPNSGLYDWIIPPTPSPNCLVKVMDAAGFAEDSSDSVFTILSPTITVTTPNGGEIVAVGDPWQISWSWVGTVTNVNLYYSMDGGSSWELIAGPLVNSGSYDWIIPDTPSENCMVRVSDVAGFAQDDSDTVFTIFTAGISSLQRDALIALYNSTDGDNWIDNTNWRKPGDQTQFNDPGTEHTWFGISCDANNANVIGINMENNNLVGTIPAEVNDFSSLATLYLNGNQLTGAIPNLSGLTNLSQLNLAVNQLTGSIPSWLNTISTLTTIDVNDNQFSGTIPDLTNLSQLTSLKLASNQISGTIPTWLNSLFSLTVIDFSNNQLSGDIPNLGDLTNLQYFAMAGNQLTGSIPAWLGSLTGLTHIILSENLLTGTIPTEIGLLSNLVYFNLGENQLTGTIPTQLVNLSALQTLALDSNQLTGTIPAGFGSIYTLTYIDLNNNALSGSIPVELGNLTALNVLHLASNHLVGELPSTLSNLTNLNSSGLDLRWNGLYTYDSGLRDFLNSKQELSNWESTQTIAPTAVTTSEEAETSTKVSWAPIDYTENSGGYNVYYTATSGSGYTLAGTTADKTEDYYVVSGLESGTTYYFIVETFTSPHSNNQNTVTSEPSIEESATTLEVESVTITSPNGGEVLEAGSDFNITWTTIGALTPVELFYSTDNGSTWQTMDGLMPNYDSFTWSVPYSFTTYNQCLIRITDSEGVVLDESDAPFTIQAPSITITSPNGGEIWDMGSTYSITWSTTGSVTPVELFYSTDNGTTWNTVDSLMPNNGSFSWTVPNTPSNQCLIRITNSEGLVMDESDSTFTIVAPTITVITPNGGEVWQAGTQQNITWSYTGNIGAVEFYYSIDNGSTWDIAEPLTPNTGSFSWTVPNTPSNQCLIRIRDGNNLAMDQSDNVFTILSAGIDSGERDALIALYNSTSGDNWTNNTNWRKPGDPTQFNDPGTEYTWFGVTCDALQTHVTEIDLQGNNLVGSIPDLSGLTQLASLNLSQNGLSGNMPTLNTHANLITLRLDRNSLSGTIPDLSALVNLETFNLAYNQLSGSIPSWLNSLVNLVSLELYSNDLTGAIPDLSSLVNLSVMDFSANELSGNIPSALNNLTNLTVLNLRGNFLDGDIPDLSNLTALTTINLTTNQLTGSIPVWLNNFTNLQILHMGGNQLTGTIPDLGNLTQLTVLSFGDNLLSGSFPAWINNCPNLIELYLSSNNLNGEIPVLNNLIQLEIFSAMDNDFTGSIANVAALVQVKNIYLENNRFNGGIPSALSNLTVLEKLHLEGNILVGELPASLTSLTALQTGGLDIRYNGLYTSDSSLRDFLNTKQYGGNWESYQTIAPTGLSTSEETTDTVKISWTPISYTLYAGGYNVYYSTTPGSNYQLAGTTADKTEDNYTVTGLNSNTVYYFVVEAFTESNGDNKNTVTSDYSTEISTSTLESLSLTITTPNGSESWLGTSNQTITWTTTAGIDNVMIEYSLDNGSSWNTITSSTPNTGNYQWNVPNTPSANCLVRITDTEGPTTDISDAVFTIIEYKAITILSPNGAESWEAATVQTITWSNTGTIANVLIEYSIDNGSTWEIIAASALNSGSYEWTIPNTPSGNCLVRVTDAAGTVADISDAVFNILVQRTLTVTSPNGGESWLVSSTYPITWVSTGAIANVSLEYSTDGGSTWNSIVSDYTNSGTYNWVVPEPASTDCLIRVSDMTGPALDTTDAVFTTSIPMIPQSERDALIAFYNSTRGQYWYNKTNWLKPGDPTQFNDPGTENTWYGITCNTDNTHVEKIIFNSNNLSGSLPDLSDLTELTVLNLRNSHFTSSIPSTINNLSNLTYLGLYNCELSGNIPDLGNLTQLVTIDLSFNDLTGTIPASLNALTNLERLWLYSNQLDGTIPDFSSLTNLTWIDLRNNALTGNIPAWITSLTNLSTLNLSNNQLSGSLPTISSMASLMSLSLNDNQFTGAVPDISGAPNLTSINLSNNLLSGDLPASFTGLDNLDYIRLANNQLTGSLPAFSSFPNAIEVNFEDNQFSGEIPSLAGNVRIETLYLGSNQLTGAIPLTISSKTHLRIVELQSNQLTGTIPDLSNLTDLITLDLSDNQLIDSFPDISAANSLQTLNIYSNQLNGTVPTWIGNLVSLRTLAVQNNQFSGALPELYNSSISKINFSHNQFTGSIPATIGSRSSLTEVYLNDNQLDGAIPINIGYLHNVEYLYLNGNKLSGSIPDSLSYLDDTLIDGSGLNLSWNGLYTADTTLRDLLNTKQIGGDWEGTQTIAPTNLSSSEETPDSIKISWAPITYTGDTGGYRVYYSTTSGSDYTLAGSTTDKTIDNYTVTGLDANTPYYFVLEAFTESHANNQNVVISEYSSELSASTLENLSITITAPNGGENWEGGTTQTITWATTGNISDVKIEYSSDNGTSWNTIIASASNTGSYNWTVANTPSNDCLVKITDAGGTTSDLSDSVFSILEQRTIAVTTPNGGEAWEGGFSQTITWSSTGNIVNVGIEYSSDNGTTWNSIITSTTNSGSYSWNVPNIPSTQCLIRIKDVAGSASDTSDAVFTITEMRTVTVVSPNGGESWSSYSFRDITWITTGTVGSVAIDYSTDNGVTWNSLVSSAPNNGIYNWQVPYLLSTECFVRISDTGGPATDISDAVFTISEPVISDLERTALIALYNSTNGDSWTDNTNWRKPGDPTQFNDPGTENTWYGVTLSEGRVSKIELIGNNLSGSLPDLSDLTALQVFNLSNNSISGNLPTWLSQLYNLEILNLEINQLDGTLPDLISLTQLQQLSLGNNNFSGELPTWLNSLSQLIWLRLGNNNFTGTIPDLTGLALLRILDLGSNQLTGSIPTWLNQLVDINSLNLSTNQLTGTIPDMSNLTTLAYFYLQSNQLTGTIPTWLSTHTNLRGINLNSNQLTGTIPDLSNLTLLSSLYLNNNQLTGSIPAGLGNLTQLMYLHLSDNQLSSGIPPELGNLTNLRVLTLHNNHLSGGIPAELGDLTQLLSLKLNGNQLIGSIPDTLAALASLYNSGGFDIAWNGLYTSNTVLRDFLNSKTLGNDWEGSQTIAPEGLSASEETHDSVKIAWTPIQYQGDSGGYRVYYSTVSGSGYSLAGTTTDKTEDNYIITGLSSNTQYYFVVETITNPHDDNSNTVLSEYSQEVTTSTLEQPTLTITSPNGGESWEATTTQTISWDSTGNITDVMIEYSTDNGTTWNTITSSTSNNGAFDWTVPNELSTVCLVKISDLSGLTEDTSDAIFTITEQRTLILNTPNGGELWEGNSSQNITWTHTGDIPTVKLEYSIDNGGSWNVIIASVSNNGSYNWTVPNTPSANCLVRVNDTAGPSLDVSDGVFTIVEQRTLSITSPDGGEAWEGGTGQVITWASTGSIQNVYIEYSLDNGGLWNSITNSTVNSGSFVWTVPNTPSGNCLIRIGDTAGPALDTSNGLFTIVEQRTITVTTPNGGERWFIDSTVILNNIILRLVEVKIVYILSKIMLSRN